MKRVLKVIAVAVGIPPLLLIGCIAADQISRSRAKPPASVTDVPSCLAWLKEPRGAYRITVDGAVYYQITGPAGRISRRARRATRLIPGGDSSVGRRTSGISRRLRRSLLRVQKERRSRWKS